MKALRVVVPLLVLLLATPLFATNILYSNLGSGGSGSDPVNGSLIGGGFTSGAGFIQGDQFSPAASGIANELLVPMFSSLCCGYARGSPDVTFSIYGDNPAIPPGNPDSLLGTFLSGSNIPAYN